MPVSRDSYCKCLYYSANALARNITRMAEKAFEPTGLSPSHGFVLMTVNKQPGITAGEIADIMQLQPSTITRFVDKLEDDGFVTRQSDGKFIQVFPTSKAKKFDEALKSAWRSLYKRYTDILGEENGRELTAAIYEATSKLDE